MDVNCVIFELIYNMVSEYTIGIITENVKNNLINALLYDMNCFYMNKNCIQSGNC